MSAFNALPLHLQITGAVLFVLVFMFLSLFLMPGIRHWFRLRSVGASIGRLGAKAKPTELQKVFSGDASLAHLWREFEETLHSQTEDRGGKSVVVAVRSTVPAEMYFSDQFVVDSRLRSEFFKHLPGIFTGIGIIGTFGGLIEGLRQFQVSENPVAVRLSLESLMHSVGEAFFISATAIFLAMAVTFLEKLLLASLYRRTEGIAHAIDANFDAGAGEEYLARLVSASEDSASQAKILKDALVTELGDLLKRLTAAQIASSDKHHQQLAQRIEEATNRQVTASQEDSRTLSDSIAASIRETMKGPLEAIAATVKTASGDQSAAAIQMLNDVMVSFSQRLNDLFGGQISGLNDLNKQTAQGMQDAVRSLQSLVASLEQSGKRSTEDMAAQMAAAAKAMEERQGCINAETQAFVEQIRKLVDSSQSETQEKLQETLATIGQQMTTILSTLSATQANVFEANRDRETAMTDRAQGMVSEMASSVENAAKEIGMASKTMSQSVSALSVASTSSIEKMNLGAERINSAASNFATAGDRVGAVMTSAAGVGAKLTEVSGSLTASAGAMQEVLRDYRLQRDAVVQLLAEVRATVELARKEASMTGDVLQRIEASTARLATAHKQADEYLDGVSKVLAKSNEAFADSVLSTLGRVNHEFHSKLSAATALLSSAVQELEVTLGGLSPAPRR